MQTAIPCIVMRGGTSKGLYFRSSDLPDDVATRDKVLLAAMGAPDLREIDGMGGAHPLTSKVAVVSPPSRPDADVDYLFLQVVVDEPRVDAGQNCGNLLAGIGPYAIETGMIPARDGVTDVRINMLNTKSIAVARIETPRGRVRYDGAARIDGVPGTAAPIPIDFLDVAGSSCGALLPTGHARDTVNGIELTAIDNGMPVVVMRARDFGKTGYETPEGLEADAALKAKIEAIRLAIGPKMNLGDVTKKTVPKMCLAAPAKNGGAIATRNFIPHRVHEAIGVFGAVSVATACVVPGSIAAEVAGIAGGSGSKSLEIEHPTGFFTVDMDVTIAGGEVKVHRAALLRTARMLMRGEVYVPSHVWSGR
ncbi:MAG TPA: 4-oxalomesaconate tautomerase [Rhizomicrobium sp.]|nr:4-oxalomesaconate tautomerase [Rhizomicrobium sp.]